MTETADISPEFQWNPKDQFIVMKILPYEGTPLAITQFAKVSKELTDYSYWYLLGTLWVNYSGQSDLQLWKRLFRNDRPKRKTCLMKPSEVAVYHGLPERIRAYRAHRQNERDWISYTLTRDIAERFAREHGVNEIVEYELRRKDVIALFLRRGEQEIIMLNPSNAKRIATHQLSLRRSMDTHDADEQ